MGLDLRASRHKQQRPLTRSFVSRDQAPGMRGLIMVVSSRKPFASIHMGTATQIALPKNTAQRGLPLEEIAVLLAGESAHQHFRKKQKNKQKTFRAAGLKTPQKNGLAVRFGVSKGNTRNPPQEMHCSESLAVNVLTRSGDHRKIQPATISPQDHIV